MAKQAQVTHGNLSITQIILSVFTIVMLIALSFILFKPLKVLPELQQTPTYHLIDQNNNPVQTSDLYGKVTLYNFIYTHCTTVCPAITGQMLQIQRMLADDGLLGNEVMLVTMTFDPERDTPERLRTYAQELGTAPEGWMWMTGDLIDMKRVVGAEFGVYFEKTPLDREAAHAAGLSEEEIEQGYDFIHSTIFVLTDYDGTIRAEYRELVEVERIMTDIQRLVREEQAEGLAVLPYRLAHFVKAY